MHTAKGKSYHVDTVWSHVEVLGFPAPGTGSEFAPEFLTKGIFLTLLTEAGQCYGSRAFSSSRPLGRGPGASPSPC